MQVRKYCKSLLKIREVRSESAEMENRDEQFNFAVQEFCIDPRDYEAYPNIYSQQQDVGVGESQGEMSPTGGPSPSLGGPQSSGSGSATTSTTTEAKRTRRSTSTVWNDFDPIFEVVDGA